MLKFALGQADEIEKARPFEERRTPSPGSHVP
jgi:hypothetical protein